MNIPEDRIVLLSQEGNVTLPSEILQFQNWHAGQKIKIHSEGKEIKLISMDSIRSDSSNLSRFFGVFSGMQNNFTREKTVRK